MKKLWFLLMSFLLLLSCEKTAPEDDYLGDMSGPAEVSHGAIVLGDRLEDPYSLGNVRQAVKSLYPSKAESVVLSATHIYVRFLPKNEEEYSRLMRLGISLMDHPLDYRIVRDGDYYHDPSLPESNLTWQYAVVSPAFIFPDGIRYEILDECYIPDSSTSVKADGIDWALVEAEAFRLTGNSELYVPMTRAESSSYPKGRITIVDDSMGKSEEKGLSGVKVMCNTFVKCGFAYTDDEGNYTIEKKFSSSVRYRIVFQNRIGFGIGLNKVMVPASTSSLGKGGAEGVSYKIDASSDRALFCRAVANNAACLFFDSCSSPEYKMTLPPSNVRIWLFQFLDASSAVMLQHGAYVDNTRIGQFLGDFKSVAKMFLPDITLGVNFVEDYSDIYALTVHELSHAAHFNTVGTEYWDKYISHILNSFVSTGGITYGSGSEIYAGYCEVGEMWAYYMQNAMYTDRYGDTGRVFGTTEWFYPQILLYLDERGLDRGKIQKALAADVITKESLKKKLVELYPDFETVVNQAFDRYSK